MRTLCIGALAGAASTAEGLDAMVSNGSFANIAAAAGRGEDVDDMVFDAALDTALETGSSGALYGIYGGRFWTRQATGN